MNSKAFLTELSKVCDFKRWGSAVDKDSDSCGGGGGGGGGSISDASAAKKMKQSRDPQSHRIIEKRRRDRMNQSLTDLSRLIPAAYLKQGQSRVEKAEIIELATQHIVALTAQLKKCEATLGADFPGSEDACCIGKFYQGFREASKAAVAYLTEQESFSTNDPLCSKLRAYMHSLSQRVLPTDSPETPTQPPQKAEPPISEDSADAAEDLAAAATTSPTRSVSCSTDEAAFFDSPTAGAVASSAIKETRRDPKSSFKARFEAETTTQQQQRIAGQKRKAPQAQLDPTDADEESDDDDGGCSGGSPGLDYRDRVELLDRCSAGAAAAAEAEQSLQPGPDAGGVFLPGFVLHASGTFYEPVVIPPSSLGAERVTAARVVGPGSRRPLHPVSIPVNFRVTRFVRSSSGGQ